MQSVTFQISPSRYLAIWIIALHACVIVAIGIVHTVWWVQIGLLWGVILHFKACWVRAIRLMHRQSVITLYQKSSGQWGGGMRSGQRFLCEIHSVYLTRFMIVLQIGLYQRKIRVIIPCDALSPFAYKCLYIRLGFYTKLSYQKQMVK